jgi:hypothetical protein
MVLQLVFFNHVGVISVPALIFARGGVFKGVAAGRLDLRFPCDGCYNEV